MLEKCDCLNFCGDDPAVHKGTAQPCPYFLRSAQLAERARDLAKVGALLEHHETLLPGNEYCYFELAYTRTTGWMAWICTDCVDTNPNRKVLANGQGETPGQACALALAKLKATA